MRLNKYQHTIIQTAVVKHFGANAKVWLFGSRVDDSLRGGDIDLLVETQLTNLKQITRAEITFLAEIQTKLGEQKIDLLLDYPEKKSLHSIFSIAKQQGILL